MKTATFTFRIDPQLKGNLDLMSRQLGRTRSDLVREGVRRQGALFQFEETRRTLLPLAEGQGILTDEDVFKMVS